MVGISQHRFVVSRINKKHFIELIPFLIGLFSVMVRQTNIIWVAMLLGDYSLKQFHYHCVKARRKRIELPEITEEVRCLNLFIIVFDLL